MTTLVLYPLSLTLLLGSPESLPCTEELPPYRVQQVEALTKAPSGPSVDAVRLSYDVASKTLTVYPVNSGGRVFCNGFEQTTTNQRSK